MLTKNVLLIAILLLQNSCSEPESNLLTFHDKIIFELPSGKKALTYVAMSESQKSQGLSGVQDKDFSVNQAMIFYYKEDGVRHFWMPDTYFNLVIFFLDKDFKILNVERDVPHHPGLVEPPKIYRTKGYFTRYVLEMKSSSPLAKNLKPGHKLRLIKGSFP